MTGLDEQLFRAHLEEERFLAGVRAGRWRLVGVEWPHAVIAVSAAEREGSPSEFALKFTADGYPGNGVTAAAWDLSSNSQLDERRRPAGYIAGHVFRTDWNGGTALYAPWDRTAVPGHNDWAALHHSRVWGADSDIVFYLEQVWEVLNDDDYTGVKTPTVA